MIDTPRRLAYIAALATAAAIVFAGPALATEYTKDLGALLPRWSKKIGEHRYRSPWDWEMTMRWLDKTYSRSYPRIRIINQPGIKAIHLSHPSKRGWDGINIYETKNGEVRMYVLPPQPAPKQARRTQAKRE